jgi:hypothetical protein
MPLVRRQHDLLTNPSENQIVPEPKYYSLVDAGLVYGNAMWAPRRIF